MKKTYKNLLTVIIPRHIERVKTIKKELENLDLKIHLHEPKKEIDKNTDIYIVNSYGKTKSFYYYCKNVFLGGSIINHGGQNPLEATRYGCNILHGPNIENFEEIYNYLGKLKISLKVNNYSQLSTKLIGLLSKKHKSNLIRNKLNKIGDKILSDTYNEVYKFIQK